VLAHEIRTVPVEDDERHVGARGEERLCGVGHSLRLDEGPLVRKRPSNLGAKRFVAGDEESDLLFGHLPGL